MIFGNDKIAQNGHSLNDDRISKYNQLNAFQEFHFGASQFYENKDYLGFASFTTQYLLHQPIFIAILAIIGVTTAVMGVFFGFFTTAVVSRRVKLLEFIGCIMLIFKSF